MKNHRFGRTLLTFIFYLFIWSHSYAKQPSVKASIGDRLLPTNAPSLSINLTNYITADAATNLVRVTTSLTSSNGTPLGFTLQLFPDRAPRTVANFLSYVNDGAYENTLIHRSVPGFIVQTGGFDYWGNQIPTWTNIVPSEAANGLSNIRGTVAMALVGSDSNSATDQWFVNLANNSQMDTSYEYTNNLGVLTTNPPFTVFAQVIGTGMNTVDAVAALPIYRNLNAPFNELPLLSTNTANPVALTNLVHISRVATIPYFALSSDSAAYAPRISNSTLFIDYTGGTNPPTNPVTISLFATDTNGLSTNTSFQVWHLTNQTRTIDYPVITNQPYTTNPFSLPYWPSTSDGTSLSGSNVSFSGPLGFGKDGKAYYTGTGTLTFTYVQPSSLFYRGVTNSSSFVISKAPQTITFTGSSGTVVFSTNPYTLTNLPLSSSTLPVSLSITNSPATWKITNSQLLFTSAGTVTLVANQSGNSNYLAALPVTNTIVVSKATQTITFPQIPNQNIPVTSPVPLKATTSSGLGISYRIVSGSGVITNNTYVKVTGHGTIMVAADQLGDGSYLPAISRTNSFGAKLTQTLSPLATIPSKVYTNPLASFSVKVPTTSAQSPTATIVALTATGPASISNGVSNNNIVTVTGAGTVTLTATQAGDDYYFPASVSTSFIVAKASQKISTFAALTSKTNGMAPFTVSIPSINSTNPVTVRATGAGYVSASTATNVTVTMTNAGKLTITASQSGNSNYLAATSVATSVAVAKGNQSIIFPSLGNHLLGDLVDLGAYSTNAAGGNTGLKITYTVSSSPKNIGYLTNGYEIQTLGTGTITVVASQTNSTGYNAATSVTNKFPVSLQ